MKYLLLFELVLLLSSCGTPEVSIPAPTPEAINITYPSALQPWADYVAGCASDNPLIALYFMRSDSLDANIQPKDIVLELGQPDDVGDLNYISQVGWEQVVVVVNKENPLSLLSRDELMSIFSGQGSKSDNGSGQSTRVWVLPVEEPTRLIFDLVVMQKKSLTTEAILAPDPGAMLEAISQNVNAIGYLPGSFLTINDSSNAGKVKIVHLEPSLEAQLRQPVIAITQSEPKGLLRRLLVCLDSKTP